MATLTARESEILTLSWECFKNDSTVNYGKLAELAGLKNNASATTAYLSAKKKMQANGSSALTAREREILALAWKCFTTPPQVDYTALAEKAGLKNKASATTAFLSAKKKMLAASDSGTIASNGEGTPAKKTRKTLPSTRIKAAMVEEEDDSIVEPASPPLAKKRKRASGVAEPSPKSAAILAAVADEGDGEAEVEAPKKKTRRVKGKKARSELDGREDEVESKPAEEDLVEAELFESAQEFLKGEED